MSSNNYVTVLCSFLQCTGTIGGELRLGVRRKERAPQPCIRRTQKDPDHDAAKRIGVAEAPKRRVHSTERRQQPCHRSAHHHLGPSSADLARLMSPLGQSDMCADRPGMDESLGLIDGWPVGRHRPRPQSEIQTVLTRITAVDPAKNLLLLTRRQTAWPPGRRPGAQRLQLSTRLRCRIEPFVDRRPMKAEGRNNR